MPKRIPRYINRKLHETNPVLLAFTVAVLIALIPLVLVLKQQSELRQATQRVRRTQAELVQTQSDLQGNRQAVSRGICVALNQNAKSNNGQTAYLQSIIRLSSQANPQRTPAEQARAAAFSHAIIKDLGKLAVPSIPCDSFIEQIGKLIPPRDHAGRTPPFLLPQGKPEFPKVPDLVRRAAGAAAKNADAPR